MAQDRAHQRKGVARGGNTGKEAPIHERLTDIGGDEQPTPAAQHYCGNEDRDTHEDSAFLADGGPAKEHPRNHQLRRRQTRDIYKANSCTYTAHDDHESLVCFPSSVVWIWSTQRPMAAMTQKKAS